LRNDLKNSGAEKTGRRVKTETPIEGRETKERRVQRVNPKMICLNTFVVFPIKKKEERT
jgi:hypothetical protein